MAAIGTLTPTRDGGWAGPILIMANTVKVKLVPNDNQANPKAPAFRVFAGDAELGAAWQQRTNENAPREFLSVSLDFPGLPGADLCGYFLFRGWYEGTCGVESQTKGRTR